LIGADHLAILHPEIPVKARPGSGATYLAWRTYWDIYSWSIRILDRALQPGISKGWQSALPPLGDNRQTAVYYAMELGSSFSQFWLPVYFPKISREASFGLLVW
jgi:hypothetical protein